MPITMKASLKTYSTSNPSPVDTKRWKFELTEPPHDVGDTPLPAHEDHAIIKALRFIKSVREKIEGFPCSRPLTKGFARIDIVLHWLWSRLEALARSAIAVMETPVQSVPLTALVIAFVLVATCGPSLIDLIVHVMDQHCLVCLLWLIGNCLVIDLIRYTVILVHRHKVQDIPCEKQMDEERRTAFEQDMPNLAAPRILFAEENVQPVDAEGLRAHLPEGQQDREG
ncbi:MAG: hypothetical protein M1828_005258 [Chrysothrix sp. TS-e1954]|nr:MAG: hypothetical protein M1828_005258 [Chrysothrix sp. TS-e1954]